MIKNFDEVKKQLAELSDVVNKFKSEQVQLKIVEIVFRGAGIEVEESDGESDPPPAPKKRARRKKNKGTAATPEAGSAKKRATSGTGPGPLSNNSFRRAFSIRSEPLVPLLTIARPRLGTLRTMSCLAPSDA